MGSLDLLTAIMIMATACHLTVSQLIISNALVSTDLTSEGHGSPGRSKRAVNVQLTSEQIKELVAAHNYRRSHEGASNMEFMTWNQKLAEMGQLWAEKCVWKHGQPTYSDPPYEKIGQNLWGHEATPANLSEAVTAFWDESQNYDYSTLKCSKVCGHYTQVVWATSKEVGCGLKICPQVSTLKNAGFLVCNYGPAGNYVDEKPYKKGPACSQCESGKSWCVEGLCTDTCNGKSNCECAAICKNCATFNKDTCSCECADGWRGTDCSEPCVDHDDKCGLKPGKPGWPFSWCSSGQYMEHVRKQCPKFCKLCNPGQPNQPKCTAKPVGPGLTYEHGNGFSGSAARCYNMILPHYLALMLIVLIANGCCL